MKRLLLAAIALCMLNGAFAQGIKLGLKAGANLSTVTDDSDAKMKFSYHAGGFLEFNFSDRVSFQPELLLSVQGAKSEGEASVTVNTNYINVPLLLKLKIVEGLAFEIGPQAGILVGGTRKQNGESKSVKEFCEALDVTALGGLSYTFADHFVIGARYGLGLTNVFKENTAIEPKNSVIQLGIGYKF